MSDPTDFARLRAGLRRWSEADVQAALERFRERRAATVALEDTVAQTRQGLRRWEPEQVERGLAEFRFRRGEVRQNRRALLRVAAGVALAAALVLVGWRVLRQPQAAETAHKMAEPRPVQAQLAAAAATPPDIAFPDGSRVTLGDRASRVAVSESSAERVVVVVDAGRATFRVKHRPERAFLVKVGDVLIEDVGTVFRVERGAEQVTLHVEEGKVRVTWQSQARELQAGAQGTFPLGPAAQPSEKDQVSGAAPAGEPKPASEAGWRAAAREGRYAQAFELLEKDGFGSVREDPSDLLMAADVARLSGHPAEAVAPLRKLVRRHHGDPRGPAAAFTLGSVLLRDLGRPAEAAQAFAQAEQLAPGGNLAEDALARATEAWLRAGDRARAEATFARYSSSHPGGRHLAHLKQLLQSPR